MTGLLVAILMASSDVPTKHERCLAKVIHHESRGESFRGKVATRDVVKNRMRKSGKSCTQVVYQKHQFSWTTKPHKKIVKKRYKAVMRAKPVLGEGYLWFYSGKKPMWAYKMQCKKLDSQYFCK